MRNRAARQLLSDLWDRYGDDCWEWPLSRKSDGYGVVQWDGKTQIAHRVAYEFLVGPIPEGLTLDHLCRNRGCVNPDHLEPVTRAENMRRAHKTHCANGHEFTPENTYWRTNGVRACRQCGRDRNREHRDRKRVAA